MVMVDSPQSSGKIDLCEAHAFSSLLVISEAPGSFGMGVVVDGKRFAGLVLFAFISIIFIYAGCGGGGGNDVVDDGEFQGAVGVGADGVTVFWRYYTGNNFGLGSFALEDGSFIMAGNRGPDINEQDVYLFKTDDEGVLQWEEPYPLSGWEEAEVLRKTGDGGYILAGTDDNPAGDEDFLLVKTGSSGTRSWMTTWDNGWPQEGQSVWPAAAGGYLFLGNSAIDHNPFFNWDACMYSVSNSGAWAGTVECYGSTEADDLAYAMEKLGDGSFILAGALDGQAWLVKTDDAGQLEKGWPRTYGAGTAYAVRALDDGGFIMAGKNAHPFENTNADVLVIRTDASGSQVWSKTFGGEGFDCANGIALAGTDAVVVAGQTDSFHTYTNDVAYQMLYLIKLDLDGNVVWQKVKGLADNTELASSIREVSDGGFIIAAGYGNVLVKTDRNGDTVILGTKDVSLTIPGVTGLIDFGNAVEAAGGAAQSIILPWNMGYQGLEWVLQVMDEGAGSVCDSGAFAISPDPAGSVSQGDEFDLTFIDCQTAATGDSLTFNGTLSVAFDTLTGTFSSSTYYAVETGMTTTGFDVQDDMGILSFTGSLGFDRTVSSGGITETARSASPATLSFSEEGVTNTLSSFSMSASGDPVNGLELGADGETILYSHLSPALTASILLEIQDRLTFGPGLEDPSGSFTVTAEDDSSLAVSLDDGSVSLAVDTDGDGSADGSLGTTWEELY
jgi:hypothetical protein